MEVPKLKKIWGDLHTVVTDMKISRSYMPRNVNHIRFGYYSMVMDNHLPNLGCEY